NTATPRTDPGAPGSWGSSGSRREAPGVSGGTTPRSCPGSRPRSPAASCAATSRHTDSVQTTSRGVGRPAPARRLTTTTPSLPRWAPSASSSTARLLQLGEGAHAAVLDLGNERRALNVQPPARAGGVAGPAEHDSYPALLCFPRTIRQVGSSLGAVAVPG